MGGPLPLRFDDAFTVESDGHFEIIASANAREGNWLPLHPDGRQLNIRMYFLDWESETPASIAIEQWARRGCLRLP